MNDVVRYLTDAIVFLVIFSAFLRAVRSGNRESPYRLIQRIGYATIGGFIGFVIDMWVGSQALPGITTQFVGGISGHFVYTGWQAVYHWFSPLSNFIFMILGALFGWYIAVLFPQSMQLPSKQTGTQ